MLESNDSIIVSLNGDIKFTKEGRKLYGWHFAQIGISISSIKTVKQYVDAIMESEDCFFASVERHMKSQFKKLNSDSQIFSKHC